MNFIKAIQKNLQFAEGGNLQWQDKEGNTKEVERIPLDKGITRGVLVSEVESFIRQINSLYKKKYKTPLMNIDKELNKDFFSGSTRPLLDKKISDEEFVKYKKTIGDIDFQVNELKKDNIKEMLQSLPKLKGFEIVHVKDGGNQMITAVKSDKLGKTFQTDFEFKEFINDMPSDWSLFSHASDWEDMKQQAKGFLKQYLLRAILRENREKVIIRKRRKQKGKPDQVIDSPPAMEHTVAYSVDRGFREKWKKVDEKGGVPIVEEIPPKDAAYSKNIGDFFKALFPNSNISASKVSTNDLSSFTTVTNHIKKFKTPEVQQKIFNEFFDLLFGPGAQKMDRSSKLNDLKPKLAGVRIFKEQVPSIKITKSDINKIKAYYRGK